MWLTTGGVGLPPLCRLYWHKPLVRTRMESTSDGMLASFFESMILVFICSSDAADVMADGKERIFRTYTLLNELHNTSLLALIVILLSLHSNRERQQIIVINDLVARWWSWTTQCQ